MILKKKKNNRNKHNTETKMMYNTDPTNTTGAREGEPVPVSYMSLAMLLIESIWKVIKHDGCYYMLVNRQRRKRKKERYSNQSILIRLTAYLYVNIVQSSMSKKPTLLSSHLYYKVSFCLVFSCHLIFCVNWTSFKGSSVL